MIIRAAADAARPDGCESFCVEWIVSRPFHGRSVRPREILRRLPTRGKRLGIFPEEMLRSSRREIKSFRVKCNQTCIDVIINDEC